MTNSQSSFKPAWWLRNRHLQTIWSQKVRRLALPSHYLERIKTDDNDFIDLAWVNQNETKELVLIIHGLGGSMHSNYSKAILQALAKNQYQAVLMHLRGCSSENNHQAESYHAGAWQDVDRVLEHIYFKNPQASVSIIAYSIGASILINGLQHGFTHPLETCVAVSPPFELQQSANALNRGFARIYQKYLLDCLKIQAKDKIDQHSLPYNHNTLKQCRNFWQFDDQVTAPLHGFTGVDEYYQQCSCRNKLKNLDTPLLIIHAKDDPFSSEQAIPTQSELSKFVDLEVYPHGGHVGFVSGKWPWKPEYWLENRIIEHLNHHYRK